MFQFFNSITDVIGIAIDFVISAIEMVVFLFTYIAASVTYLIALIAYLPPFAGTFVAVTVSIIVILQLINKGS